jgi:hypothetical protein
LLMESMARRYSVAREGRPKRPCGNTARIHTCAADN